MYCRTLSRHSFEEIQACWLPKPFSGFIVIWDGKECKSSQPLWIALIYLVFLFCSSKDTDGFAHLRWQTAMCQVSRVMGLHVFQAPLTWHQQGVVKKVLHIKSRQCFNWTFWIIILTILTSCGHPWMDAPSTSHRAKVSTMSKGDIEIFLDFPELLWTGRRKYKCMWTELRTWKKHIHVVDQGY